MAIVSIIDDVTLTDGTWMEQVIAVSQDIQGTFITYTSLALTVGNTAPFSVGGDITGDGDNGNTGVGVVRQIDTTNNILYVDTTSGAWVATNGIDNANPYVGDETTITSIDNDSLMTYRANSNDLTPSGSGQIGTFIP
jgi:hypothetical protein